MRLFYFLILASSAIFLIIFFTNFSQALQYSSSKNTLLKPICTFKENLPNVSCYINNINDVIHTSENYLSNSTTSRVPLTSTVNLINSPNLLFWKSKVRSPTIPDDRYFHVAEPSFGSNGYTCILYCKPLCCEICE